MKKVALVLGGGGARGLAHVGVLKALEENGIRFDMIVGCSFGALVGGMYAQHPDMDAVLNRLQEYMQTDAFHQLGLDRVRKPSRPSDDSLRQFTRNIKDWVMLNVMAKRIALLKKERLQRTVELLIEEGSFADLQIPFACNATDIISGKPVLFTEGDLRWAISASMTIPGFFPPLEWDGKLLVDGAVTYNLPIRHARELGADIVIAVDVHPILHPENDFRNVIDIILRTKTITANIFSDEMVNGADILISPPVKEYFWYEFDRHKEIIKAGEAATYQKMKQLKHLRAFTLGRRLLRRVS